MNQEFNQEPTAEKLSAMLNPENLRQTVVASAPPFLPIPCFPEVIGALLEHLMPLEWEDLNERGRNFLKWISVKAEAIDSLLPESSDSPTRGFELLAINREGNGFVKISEQSKELEIPSVMLRFSTLIATFLTVRLLLKQMKEDGFPAPSLVFTQNVDGDYLNYPRALQNLLQLFPECQQMFHFEVSELLTEDYVTTIRTLAEDLGIRFVLDDTNKMDARVHQKLLDLADWIKIDFQATASIEERLREGQGEQILLHLELYAHGAGSPVIVFEGLGDESQLKSFLQERWRNSETALYQQSRERLPLPPWDRYFGLIQDYHEVEKGLFYQGLLVSQIEASEG
ncbi:MAG: hypothetical protein QF675_00665 [SAR324 cluster bacterium]|nr:hypothetical protein [SAR324 cluster bacterium]